MLEIIVYRREEKPIDLRQQRQDVSAEVFGSDRQGGANDVSTRRVLTNSVLAPDVITSHLGATHLGAVLPDELGEVTSGFRVAWVGVVVILDFIVPSIDWVFTANETGSQVLTVWAIRVDQLDIVTVEFLSVVGCEISQLPVPLEGWGRMKSSLLVCLFQDITLELIEALGWSRSRRRGAGGGRSGRSRRRRR